MKKLVQNGVMNEKFVKNCVMNAKIGPKVVRRICANSRLVDGTVCNPAFKNCWKNLLMGVNFGC